MRLLLDRNLGFQLIKIFVLLSPDLKHVRAFDLTRPADAAWDLTKEHLLVIRGLGSRVPASGVVMAARTP